MRLDAAVKWCAMVAAAAIEAWMRIPYVIQVLLAVMGLDIVSGLLAALRTRTLNSSVMFRGLITKCAVFPLLALLDLLEKPLSLPFHLDAVAAAAFIVYEALSIVENCAVSGVPIPAIIVQSLVKAKIKTVPIDEIHRDFELGDQSSVTVSKVSGNVKTPLGQPDLKVDKTVTVLEETHVEPVGEAAVPPAVPPVV